MSKTFAYMLLSAEWEELELEDVSAGGVLESFVSCEEQALEPDDPWAFGWEDFASRVAPVQFALGWDPRPTLLRSFEARSLEPLYAHSDEEAFVFPAPESCFSTRFAGRKAAKPVDQKRFGKILDATVALAREESRAVVFIGKWGFLYEHEKDPLFEGRDALRQMGMLYLTRHG